MDEMKDAQAPVAVDDEKLVNVAGGAAWSTTCNTCGLRFSWAIDAYSHREATGHDVPLPRG